MSDRYGTACDLMQISPLLAQLPPKFSAVLFCFPSKNYSIRGNGCSI